MSQTGRRRSAYPMLVRCAQRQLGVDRSLHQHLLAEKQAEQWLRPNLLLSPDGPGAKPGGGRVAMLMVKAG